MRVLYICGDFVISPVHKSLIEELDLLGVEQIVYVPLNYNTKNANQVPCEFKTIGSQIVYSPPLKLYHRILYKNKINTIVKSIEEQVNLNKIDLINSSLLCNEGGVAYELHKKYGIKFVSAIRNADLNDYFRVFKWRIPYFKRIAIGAEKLICISKLYSLRIKTYFGSELYENIKPKVEVVTNGLYDTFLDNRHIKSALGNPIKLVYTGGFQRNKNIIGVLEAIKILRKKGFNIEFTAIGNNLRNHYEKDYARKVLLYSENEKWFESLDAQPKEKLLFSLREHHIFVMLSHTETFGLSYIEALSQGLPIVYTKGEGFDRMYDEGIVGYHADSYNIEDIANAIERVIINYHTITKNISNLDLSVFKWSSIGLKYQQLYSDIIGG